MTEANENEGNEVSRTDLIREIRANLAPFDPTLENLVMFMNLLGGTEIGITLHVKGSVISGMLISGQQYFKMLVRQFENVAERVDEGRAAAATGFAEFFRPTLEGFERSHDDYTETATLPPRPQHVHLRHAQIYLSSSDFLTERLWRGRLTEVDGWSLGNFGMLPPLPPEQEW